VATLIHYSGEVLYDQLGGTIADSAHPLPEVGQGTGSSSSAALSPEIDRAYFYFPDLVIHEPGRYRVRVSLMQMDYSPDGSPEGAVKVLESVDSRSIIVEDGVVNRSRPSKRIYPEEDGHLLTALDSRERAFLRVLRDDGQAVPSPH